MKTKVKLKIADIIIQMQSKFGLEPLTEEEQKNRKTFNKITAYLLPKKNKGRDFRGD